jgi:tyrosyl-tRNA synthetase
MCAGQASSSSVQNVVEVLQARGLVQDVTSEDLGAAAATEHLTVYVGFDPTADAIHVGNLLGIIVLSWFQRCGHKAVVLLGGATGRVGDPSGKSAERAILSEEQVESNVEGIGAIIRGILERNQGDLEGVKVCKHLQCFRLCRQAAP